MNSLSSSLLFYFVMFSSYVLVSCKRKEYIRLWPVESQKEGVCKCSKCPSLPAFWPFLSFVFTLFFVLLSLTLFCFSNARGIIIMRGSWALWDSAKGMFSNRFIIYSSTLTQFRVFSTDLLDSSLIWPDSFFTYSFDLASLLVIPVMIWYYKYYGRLSLLRYKFNTYLRVICVILSELFYLFSFH